MTPTVERRKESSFAGGRKGGGAPTAALPWAAPTRPARRGANFQRDSPRPVIGATGRAQPTRRPPPPPPGGGGGIWQRGISALTTQDQAAN